MAHKLIGVEDEHGNFYQFVTPKDGYYEAYVIVDGTAHYPSDLFGRGWRPVYSRDAKREKEKDDAPLHQAKNRNSDNSHGGESASKSVKDSPNNARQGKKTGGDAKSSAGQNRSGGKRSGRGGRTRKRGHGRGNTARNAKGGRGSRNGVPRTGGYSSTRYHFEHALNKSEKRYVQEIARHLANLVGQHLKDEDVFGLDLLELVWRDGVGAEVTPALDSLVEGEREAVKVLISPDESGSCATHSGVAYAVAHEVARTVGSAAKVVVIPNQNGKMDRTPGEETPKPEAETLSEEAKAYDIVWYLGDQDAIEETVNPKGVLIYFDTYAHSQGAPKVSKLGKNVIYVSRVNVGSAEDLAAAWKLVARIL